MSFHSQLTLFSVTTCSLNVVNGEPSLHASTIGHVPIGHSVAVGTENEYVSTSKQTSQITLLEVRLNFGTTLLKLRHNFAQTSTQPGSIYTVVSSEKMTLEKPSPRRKYYQWHVHPSSVRHPVQWFHLHDDHVQQAIS